MNFSKATERLQRKRSQYCSELSNKPSETDSYQTLLDTESEHHATMKKYMLQVKILTWIQQQEAPTDIRQ